MIREREKEQEGKKGIRQKMVRPNRSEKEEDPRSCRNKYIIYTKIKRNVHNNGTR